MDTALQSKSAIEVIASFGKDGLFPHILKCGEREYRIKKVNLVHSLKDGAVRVYFFSVSDDTNYWKLGFNTDTLHWWIEDQFSKD